MIVVLSTSVADKKWRTPPWRWVAIRGPLERVVPRTISWFIIWIRGRTRAGGSYTQGQKSHSFSSGFLKNPFQFTCFSNFIYFNALYVIYFKKSYTKNFIYCTCKSLFLFIRHIQGKPGIPCSLVVWFSFQICFVNLKTTIASGFSTKDFLCF